MNLTEDKKYGMRKLNNDRKWMMLVRNLSDRYRSESLQVLKEIKEIQKLKQGGDQAFLVQLIVSIRSRPIRWIIEFIEHGGLAALLDNLNALQEKRK